MNHRHFIIEMDFATRLTKLIHQTSTEAVNNSNENELIIILY